MIFTTQELLYPDGIVIQWTNCIDLRSKIHDSFSLLRMQLSKMIANLMLSLNITSSNSYITFSPFTKVTALLNLKNAQIFLWHSSPHHTPRMYPDLVREPGSHLVTNAMLWNQSLWLIRCLPEMLEEHKTDPLCEHRYICYGIFVVTVLTAGSLHLRTFLELAFQSQLSSLHQGSSIASCCRCLLIHNSL